MPGKNQTKRLNKHLEHAEMVWTRAQLAAASFAEALDEAEKTVEENRSELTTEEYTSIQDKLAEQRAFLKDELMKARDVYVSVTKEFKDALG